MTSNFSLNKLGHAMRSGGSAPADAPATPQTKPGGRSSAFAGFNGLQGRDGGAKGGGGMAPRSMNAFQGRSPMAQAFSNAAQHARDSVNQLSQGMRHEIQQTKNGFSAFRAEAHQAARPGFGYGAVAQRHRTAQTGHQLRSQQAYANAAQNARGFFRETARGVSTGVRGAAYSVAQTMERFDPRRLAHKAARYGNAVLHTAGQAAMVGLGGALLAGGAVAYGADMARYKFGRMADAANYKFGRMADAANYAVANGVNHAMHRVDNALYRVDHAIQSAAYRVDHAVNQASHAAHSVAYQAGYMAQNAVNHVMYPFNAAAHTYQSLSHAASVFKQDMAHFNPYRMQHSYQQYHSRPQWY